MLNDRVGLRVFDIRNPKKPREVAYFDAPVNGKSGALSSPAFVPERREIWYTDGNSGFYAVRLTNDAWPTAASPPSRGSNPLPSREPAKAT